MINFQHLVIITSMVFLFKNKTNDHHFVYGTWKLTAIKNQEKTIISPKNVTITFINNPTNDNLTFIGEIMCGFYSGKLTIIHKKAISIYAISTATTMCQEEGKSTFKNKYFMWLIGTNEYKIQDEELTLISGNNELLFIKKEF